jgi:hypothetical protein
MNEQFMILGRRKVQNINGQVIETFKVDILQVGKGGLPPLNMQ